MHTQVLLNALRQHGIFYALFWKKVEVPCNNILQVSLKLRQDAIQSKQDTMQSKQDAIKSKQNAIKSKQDAIISKQNAIKLKQDRLRKFQLQVMFSLWVCLGERDRKEREETGERAGIEPMSAAPIASQPNLLYVTRSDPWLGQFKRIGFVASFKATVWTDMVDREIKRGRKIRKQREGKTARKRHGRGVREEERANRR